jgi:D-alanine-D-alanine ligase
MRVTVLAYLESEADRQPDSVVPQVTRALEANGHAVSNLCVHGDLKKLINGLERRRPELVFNLLETFGDTAFGDV